MQLRSVPAIDGTTAHAGCNSISASAAAKTNCLGARVIGVYNANASFWELFWAAFVVPILLPLSAETPDERASGTPDISHWPGETSGHVL